MKQSDEIIIKNIKSQNKYDAIDEMFEKLSSLSEIKSIKDIRKSVIEREHIQSTGLGNGIAVAHGKTNKARKFLIALGISQDGIEYNSIDKKPVHFIFLISHPPQMQDIYINVLSAIARIVKRYILNNKEDNFKNLEDNICSSFMKLFEYV
jgi:PTS system nitrogen regulatory IIA component